MLDTLLYVALSLAVGLFLAYVAWFYMVYVPRYPPGPWPWPLLGNLPQLPSGDLSSCVDLLVARHGHVLTLFLPKPNVVLANYAAVREALIDRGMVMRQRTPIFQLFAVIPNGGLISSDGEAWKEQKRIALRILRELGLGKQAMEERILGSVSEMLEHIDSHPDRTQIDMVVPIRLCIGNIINRMLFGKTFRYDNAEPFMHLVGLLGGFFKNFVGRSTALYQAWPWLVHVPLVNATYRDMQRKFNSYMEYIRSEVDIQRAEFSLSAPVNTFVKAYLHEIQQEQGKHQNPHLCIQQLYCVASDCWIGAVETTSATLGFALLHLAKYPEVQAKTYGEVEQVVGRDRFVTMHDKDAMPYTAALINEVQRMCGVIEFTFRFSETQQSISNYQIPANTSYLFYMLGIMRGPPFDDPQQFRPQRFLEADGRTQRRDLLEQFAPFGMGRHQCLGEPLARTELFLVLTTLVQKYEFHPVDGTELDLTPAYGEIIHPKRQMLKVVKRE